jgi:phosphotriesterase-related protein
MIMTVRGPIGPEEAGIVLPHEHVMVDFAGADVASPDRYDPDAVVEVARPHLAEAYAHGARTFIDCTPAYLARDPRVLLRLAEATGLHMVTNTGYYGAAGDTFLPPQAFDETADQLAGRWAAEWEGGIEDTGIRPGFIKTAVDNGPFSPVDEKLVRAACRAHLRTGLTIGCHTTDAQAAMAQLDVLDEEGVDPAGWVWIHAHAAGSAEPCIEAARRGAWVEFDGIAPGTVGQHVALVDAMAEAGLLGRTLLSHDAGWYTVGEPGGGDFRGFTTLFEEMLPALRDAGHDDDAIDRLIRRNPFEAFAVGAHPAGG